MSLWPALLTFWFQTDLGSKNSGSYLKLQAGKVKDYFNSWSWQTFVPTRNVFNYLFPLDVQNEIQLLSRVFCYSWLVCLLKFWLRNAPLLKVGNPSSDGSVFVIIVFVFVCFSYISNFMKSSAVYEASVCTFELRPCPHVSGNFFFPQIFFCGCETFRVHTQRTRIVFSCPHVSDCIRKFSDLL